MHNNDHLSSSCHLTEHNKVVFLILSQVLIFSGRRVKFPHNSSTHLVQQKKRWCCYLQRVDRCTCVHTWNSCLYIWEEGHRRWISLYNYLTILLCLSSLAYSSSFAFVPMGNYHQCMSLDCGIKYPERTHAETRKLCTEKPGTDVVYRTQDCFCCETTELTTSPQCCPIYNYL